ncbi:MAG: hypothetical protein IKZ34_03165 [Alphaproteobacteria bacterium]|nr:hypothetical protein [Alphaproteobacteria bacterium]
MYKKINIPNDWSNLSDAQVLEFIKYLKKNYRKHKVSVYYNNLYIDNVKIQTYGKTKPGVPYKSVYSYGDIINCKDINGKTYTPKDTAIYDELIELDMACREYLKRKEWWQKNGENFAAAVFTVGVVAGFITALVCGTQNTNKEQKTTKQEVRTQAQEYEATKAKTINFTDSVNQKTK